MRIYLFFLFLLLLFQSSFANDNIENILIELEQVIADRENYQKEKEQNIHIYKAILSNDPSRNDLLFQYKIFEKIYEEYKSYRYDSAFHYATKLLHTGYGTQDSILIDRARIKLSFTLVSAGMFKESLDTLQAIDDVQRMQKTDLFEYFLVYSRIYNDMAEYAEDKHYVPIYKKLVISYHNQQLSLVEKNTAQYLKIFGEKLSHEKKTNEAIVILRKLMENYNLPNNQLAQVSSNLGQLYKSSNNPELAIKYFALAAIADIKAAIKETVAIRELSALLNESGDLQRAYSYIQIAMEDANFYNAKHRKVQISYILPIIGEKQLRTVDDQRRMLLYYAVAVTILSLLVVIFIFIILKQIKNLKKVKATLAESHQNLQLMNFKLNEVNKIKEEYIGQFFNSISDYINKIENFKNNVNRKITSRKIEDIYDIVNGINTNKERDSLFINFDKTFLKIFPNFIQGVNNLFEEKDWFILKPKQPLSPELRIFALIRLGIHENEKIAKILGYSVNTIYSYKTKIKNKSLIPNEQFEQKIMDIKGL
ncbi:MAG: DUF6377 domain-containing protein [Bacteroidota bacterium]|nr:DUF6377 domain-containing protein [Bacteroidota bacterium]